MPGGRPENISISRLKPAVMPTDEDDRELTPSPPPSPPRPGRRPRRPQNPPPASTRRTRSNARNGNDETPDDELEERLVRLRNVTGNSDHEPNSDVEPELPETPPQRSQQRQRATSPFSDEADLSESPRPLPPVALHSPPASPQPSIPDPHDGHVPPNENLAACPCDPPAGPCIPDQRRFTSRRQRTFSNRGGPVPQFQDDNDPPPNDDSQIHPNIGQRPKPTPSFSRPKPGDFSFRRRRPDVNALRDILLSLN